MKQLCTLMIFLFSTTSFATGPDCYEGDLVHIKKQVKSHDVDLSGKFFCKTQYSTQKSYKEIVVPAFNKLEFTRSSRSACQDIERLSQLYREQSTPRSLPVTISMTLYDVEEVDHYCHPIEVVGQACSFSIQFDHSSEGPFRSPAFDLEMKGSRSNCHAIFDRLTRK